MQEEQLFLENNSKQDDVECNQCHEGYMKKLKHPHSFDFNIEGYIPRVCNQCGSCSDIEEIIKDIGTLNLPLSNRFIKSVLIQIICTKRIDYKHFKNILRFFKQKKIFDLYQLAHLINKELIDAGYIVNFEFILKIIYQKFKPLHAYA